jgi:hypothetical protein
MQKCNKESSSEIIQLGLFFSSIGIYSTKKHDFKTNFKVTQT